MFNKIKPLIVFSICSVFALGAFSEEKKQKTIKINKKELATETVLPVFRVKKVLRKRNVVKENRGEVGFALGSTLNDAFFDNNLLRLHFSYHLNEVHAVSVDYGSYISSGNNFQDQISGPPINIGDWDNVPLLESYAALNWEYTPYYGKISITKQGVYNLSTSTILGLGSITYGGESATYLQAGVIQKFYFSPNWGLNLDLRIQNYIFPDFLGASTVNTPPFEDENFFNMTLMFGVFSFFPFL
ncbi:MAG: outer membrane beta-barrel domain-containing protein [Bdellovibrionales bacterium]